MISRLQGDMKEAMKSGDKLKVSTIRMLLSEIKNFQISKGGVNTELDEGEINTLLQKAVKKRYEAAEAFKSGGRDEMSEKELAEAAIIDVYLPKGLSDEELAAAVDAAIAETGAASKRDMGTVMKAIMAKYPGRVDGKRVSGLVSSKLD